MTREYKISQYKNCEVISKNDHILCLRFGEFLKGYAGKARSLNLSSIEELAVGYYEHATKHIPMNQRITKAMEILIAVENEYGINQEG